MRVTWVYTVPICLTSVVVSAVTHFIISYVPGTTPWVIWIHSTVQFYLPGCFQASTIIFNFLIFKKIHTLSKSSTSQRRNHKMAMMLLVLVVVYIFCYFIRFVFHTYVLYTISTLIGRLLVTINSSVNILIYYFHDEHFRNVAKEILGLQQACQKSRKPKEENYISLEIISTHMNQE